MESSSLFVYGTLMVRQVLERVMGRSSEHLSIQDAVLDAHTRHHVEHADYPAVVPVALGIAIMGRELTDDEKCVRGCLISGLTKADLEFLDEFEGDEYVRERVKVHLIEKDTEVDAEVYLWAAPMSRLAKSLWSFADFMRDKASRWIGTEGAEEYAEVDRRRAMAGIITPPELPQVEGQDLPEFGKEFREKYWGFAKDYVPVNHGSYGAAPKPVIEAYRAIQDRSNAEPDVFIKIRYMRELIELRKRLAAFVHCDTDDLVIVNNVTTAVNTILASLTPVWEKGDKLLYFSTTVYNACSRNLQYVIDTNPHLSLSLVPVPLEYPVSHAALLKALTEAIDAEAKKGGGKIRLALVDAISSNPGVIVPWEEVTKILKQHDIISLVDGAHQIGQLPIDLSEASPDFFVSNCHKWLLAHRGAAILYAAKRYQYLMHSLPISHSYVLRSPSDATASSWVTEFEWNGTVDYSPILSVSAAFDFREFCGGEERIQNYCHQLALEAGEHVADVLGTETMRNKEGEGELVASMINVRLPIAFPSRDLSQEELRAILTKQVTFLMKSQLEKYHTHAPVFLHNKQWWTRLSAQIYTDLEDFKYVAGVLKTLSDDVESGRYLRQ